MTAVPSLELVLTSRMGRVTYETPVENLAMKNLETDKKTLVSCKTGLKLRQLKSEFPFQRFD
jgi:hypothetical protein